MENNAYIIEKSGVKDNSVSDLVAIKVECLHDADRYKLISIKNAQVMYSAIYIGIQETVDGCMQLQKEVFGKEIEERSTVLKQIVGLS